MTPRPGRCAPGSAGGFTLIELALVLFILTLVMAGAMTPLTRMLTERQSAETRRALAEAKTALLGYALTHRDALGRPYLPCPDRLTGPGAGDGREDRLPDGRCAGAQGTLPWLSLGLPAADAWGNRYTYAVALDYADAQAGITTHPPPAAGLRICLAQPASGNADDQAQATACAQSAPAAAVILSHGPNGLGAVSAHGGRNRSPTGADERHNASHEGVFISRSPAAADRPGGEFDDLLLWLSPEALIGRLCAEATAC